MNAYEMIKTITNLKPDESSRVWIYQTDGRYVMLNLENIILDDDGDIVLEGVNL